MAKMYWLLLAVSTRALTVASPVVPISVGDFAASPYAWGSAFTGFNPLPDKAGESCGIDASNAGMRSTQTCWYLANDTFLGLGAPGWEPALGASVTRPYTTGFSAPRLLGGIATHNATDDTYTPNLEFEVVTRGSDGISLVYNFSRIDATLDGFVRVGKYQDILVVLDNVPFAFVKPENRFYCSFGLGSAPDDPQEFASFVGDLAAHMVARYGLDTVSRWRFRLGTECDGPRYGPPWQNLTAPNPPFSAPDGNGGIFTSRTPGLDVYVETYIAVARALERVVPKAAFGPSNMAGISGGAGGGAVNATCDACPFLEEFADRIKAAGAPLGFIAASEYSKWDKNGFAPAAPMLDTPSYLTQIKERAGNPDAPTEVHEWGWAGWGKWAAQFGKMQWPMGAYGGAWSLGSFLYQRKGGASRVFHWGYNEDGGLGVGQGSNASATCPPGTQWCAPNQPPGMCKATCRARGYPIVSGTGWLFNALNDVTETAGSQSGLSEYVRDIPVKGYNQTVGAVKGAGADRVAVLAVHFSPNMTDRVIRRFRLEINATDLAIFAGKPCTELQITQKALNRTTSAHDQMEATLFANGGKVASEARAVDRIANMATPEGLRMLVDRAPHWMEMNWKSLQYGPFDGTVVRGSNGGCTLEFDMETPSLKLIAISQ